MDDQPARDLVGLMQATTKADLTRYARSLVVKRRDLARLVLEASQGLLLPLHYLTHAQDFVPEHLALDRIDVSAIKRSTSVEERRAFAKANGKLTGLFQQRRHVAGHLLYLPDLSMWHFFYFDHRDVQTGDNHWSGGPHLHFINYLSPHINPVSLWVRFIGDRPNIGGTLYLRYDPEAEPLRQTRRAGDAPAVAVDSPPGSTGEVSG